ncbi:glycosyltransferase family 25 protein [Neisseriaceae bacterium B1]
MNTSLRIFVISLPNSPRRPIITKRLAALNLQFQFFDGVYGKSLTQEELDKVDYDFFKYYMPEKQKEFTLGEIGCAMSHIKVYEHIVQNNIEKAIIFEDDVLLSNYFPTILDNVLKKMAKDTEILFFDHGKVKLDYLYRRKLPERFLLRRYKAPSKKSKRFIVMASAYLLTLAGAKRLLEYAYPIRMPADYLTGLLQLTGIRAYGVEPHCVFTDVATVSEIDAQGKRIIET